LRTERSRRGKRLSPYPKALDRLRERQTFQKKETSKQRQIELQKISSGKKKALSKWSGEKKKKRTASKTRGEKASDSPGGRAANLDKGKKNRPGRRKRRKTPEVLKRKKDSIAHSGSDI